MKQNRLICIFLILLLSFVGYSQVAPGGKRVRTFSSVYTDLRRACKGYAHDSEGERCRGYGGYSVSISYPAMGEDLFIEAKDGTLISVYQENKPSLKSIGRRIEWRLANGKPFAIIVRFTYYSGEYNSEAGESPYEDKYKVGESLFVKGLKGYEKIEFDVDAKTPNANERARELADGAYKEDR